MQTLLERGLAVLGKDSSWAAGSQGEKGPEGPLVASPVREKPGGGHQAYLMSVYLVKVSILHPGCVGLSLTRLFPFSSRDGAQSRAVESSPLGPLSCTRLCCP